MIMSAFLYCNSHIQNTETEGVFLVFFFIHIQDLSVSRKIVNQAYI